MMMAYSSTSGAAMFSAHGIKRKKEAKTSYKDLATDKPEEKKRFSLFGLLKKRSEKGREAA